MSLTPYRLNEIQASTAATTYFPAVAALAAGGFVVTWSSFGQDGSGYGIYGRRYDVNGVAASGEFQVNTYIANEQTYSSVTALSDGGFVVTWSSWTQDGSSYGIYGRRYGANGAAASGEFQVNTYTSSDQFLSSVTALSDGGFVVTWTSWGQDGSVYGIYGRRYSANGAAASGVFQVNTYIANEQSLPSVTALSDGGFVVTWSSFGQDGSGYGIYGRRYDVNGVAASGEFQVNAYTSGDQHYSSVKPLSDGGFVVTWSSVGQDGSSWGVYGRRYDANGTALASEFQVNTYTSDPQFLPSVTALPDGGFVVTWTSLEQDGSDFGIYGQRFASDGSASGTEFRINLNTGGRQIADTFYGSETVAALVDGSLVQVITGSDGRTYAQLIAIPPAPSPPVFGSIGAGGAIGGADSAVSSQSGDATVVGTADPNATITLRFGSTVLGTVAANGSGNWAYTLTPANLATIGQGAGKTLSATAANAAGDSSVATTSSAFTVDTVAPVPVLVIGSITSDNVVNAAEAGGAVQVIGTVSGGFKAGDTVSLTVNGVVSMGQVSAGGAFNIAVQGSDLAADADRSVGGSITTLDAAGNSGTATAAKAYGVDTAAPGAPSSLFVGQPGSAFTYSFHSGYADGNLTWLLSPNFGQISYGGQFWWGTVTGFSSTSYVSYFHGNTPYESVSVSSSSGQSLYALTITLGTGYNFNNGVYAYWEMFSEGDLVQSGTLHVPQGSLVSFSDEQGFDALKIGTYSEPFSSFTGTFSNGNALFAGDSSGRYLGTSSIAGGYVNAEHNVVSQTFSGAAEAGSTVSIFDGVQFLGNALADLSGSWSYLLGYLGEGRHSLTASVTDSAGNTGVPSAPIVFTVDSVVPVPTIALASDTGLSSTDRITFDREVRGSADAGSVVTLREGSTALGIAATDATGYWSFTLGSLTEGSHTVVASQVDAAGNAGSASLTFVLDTTVPVPVLIIGAITADNVVNASEAGGAVQVSGTVSGEFTAGDTVSLAVNGVVSTGQVDAGGAFSIAVQGSDLAADADRTVAGSVTTVDAAGNVGTATAGKAYGVDTAVPVPALAIGSITADNVVNAVEAGTAVQVSGTVSGELKAGDTVTLTVNGVVSTGQVDAGGAFSIAVEGSDLLANADRAVAGSITTVDAAGNAGTTTAVKAYGVDTAAPVPVLVIGAITADNAVNAAEAAGTVQVIGTVSGEFSAGDMVSLTVNGVVSTGQVDAGGAFSIAVQGSHLAADTDHSVAGSVTTVDAAGNIGTATAGKAYGVDTSAPVPMLAIGSITADNVVNAAEAAGVVQVSGTVSSEFTAGDTVSLTVNGVVSTGQVDAGGEFSVAVQGSDLLADADRTVAGGLTTVDSAGNVGTTTAVKAYGVDTAAPVPLLVIGSITADNVVNAAEGGSAVQVSGTVSGEFKVGDTVSLTVNGVVLAGQVDGGGAFSIGVQGSDLAADADRTVAGGLTTVDAAGNAGTATSGKAYGVDTSAPVPVLTIGAITADDVVNAAEAGGAVQVSGTVSGEFKAGDTVTLTVNGVVSTGQVDAGGAFNIAVQGSDLLADADRAVAGSITTVDAAGNVGTATAGKAYGVDTAAPVPLLVIGSITADNVVNAAEGGGALQVSGTVSGEFKAGDTVSLMVNGVVSTGQVDAGGAFSIAVQGSDLLADADRTVAGSLTTVDAAGNAGTATAGKAYGVDTAAPVPVLIVGAITADNVVNAAETGGAVQVSGTVSGEFKAGDTVSLTVNGVVSTGQVDAGGAFSIVVQGSDLAADADRTVAGSIATADAAGNVGMATAGKAYGVDTSAPVPVLVIGAITADNVVNTAEATGAVLVSGTVSGEFKAGDTVSLTVNSVVSTGQVDAAGAFSIAVQGSDLLADADHTVAGLVTTADAAGNAGMATQARAYGLASLISLVPPSLVAPEGDQGWTSFIFAVVLDSPSDASQTVSWSVAGVGSHAAGESDLGGSWPSGTIEFAAGETSRFVTVSVAADTAVEHDEEFEVTLSGASAGLNLGFATAQGTIQNDDRSVVSIAALSADQAEGSGGGGTTAYTFTVDLDQAGVTAQTVFWSVAGSGGNAADGADFSGQTSGALTFEVGEVRRTLSIAVSQDGTVEPDEGFAVSLSGLSGGLAAGLLSASGTIRNDDRAIVSIAPLSADKAEGDGTTTSFTVDLRLDRPHLLAQSVSWALAGAGPHAVDAADFGGPLGAWPLPSGVLTFAPGQTSQVVTLSVSADSLVEHDEGFTLTLSDLSAGLMAGSTTAEGRIANDDRSPVSILPATIVTPEGQDGSMAFRFVVQLGQVGVTAQSVAWAVAGAGPNPADGADFNGGVLPTGTVIFAPGESLATVTVLVAGDTLVEPDEAFTVALSGPSEGLVLATGSAAGTIVNDDRPVVSIRPEAAVQAEGDAGTTGFTFLVSLDQAALSEQTVRWSMLAQGPASADPADLPGGAPLSGVITFAAGEIARVLTLQVSGDSMVEPDETVTVVLSSASAGLALGTPTATGTILNDDASVVSIAPLVAVLAEGDADARAFTFTVSLDQATTAAQSVDWQAGGLATDATDFGGTPPGGTVLFAAGERSTVVTVLIAGDAVVELDEMFAVSLSNPSAGLVLGTATAHGTIVDDDGGTPAVSVSVAALSADQAEGDSGTTALTFTVSLDRIAPGARSVSWIVAGAGAAAADAADFAGVTGTVVFAADETSQVVTVLVSGDSVVEADESFALTLSGPSAGLVLGTASAGGTIRNDDRPLVSIAALSAIGEEGDGGTAAFVFEVGIDQASLSTQAVDWKVAGPGVDPDDFGSGLPQGRVTFEAGATIQRVTVFVSGDTTIEADESFAVVLANQSAGLALGMSSATATIVNDDRSVVSVAALAPALMEGDAGTTAYTFLVSLDRPGATEQSVQWSVAGSGLHAADDADLEGPLSGTVTFGVGETSKLVTVWLAGDRALEPDETFTLALSGASAGLSIGVPGATGTIANDDRAVVSIAAISADAPEGSTGASAFLFEVSLDQAAAGQVVHWSVAGAGPNAAGESDFVGPLSGVVSYAAGETAALVTVTVAGDQAVEPDEGFTVTLTSLSPGLTPGAASASGTIRNDDRPTASIAALSADQPEGTGEATPFTFIVSLDRPALVPLSVDWSVSGSGDLAADEDDFGGGLPSGALSFAPGEISKIVSVSVAGDSEWEPAEGFAVTLSNGSAALSIGTAVAQGTIGEDDGTTVSIAALSADQAEGDDGSTAFTFAVSLGQAAASEQTVAWSVTGSGAQAADVADFGLALPSGAVSFAPGETIAIVTVVVRSDTMVEADETFTVTLSGVPAGMVLGTSAAQGTIRNDDRAMVAIGALSADGPEGSGAPTPFTFRVTLDRPATTLQTVDWSVAGTGAAPADAADLGRPELPSGAITFAPGEAVAFVTVDVIGDTTPELDESFAVLLSNASAGLILGAGPAIATIRNDDRPVVSIAAAVADRPEGTGGAMAFTFMVSLDRVAAAGQTVDWTVDGVGADSADQSDFSGPLSGTVSVSAGETTGTVTVLVSGDAVLEPDETFRVTLSNPSAGLEPGMIAASATIVNDDVPVVSIAPLSAAHAEGTGGTTEFTFVVHLDQASPTGQSVQWSVAGSGAHPAGGSDFAGALSGTAAFVAGETSRTIVLEIAGDAAVEADEGLTVTLSNATAGLSLGAASATGVIVNDDASVSISAPAAMVAEGDSGTTEVAFSLTLTGDSSLPRTVAWSVSGAGASAADAADFATAVMPAGIAIFAAGETAKSLVVRVMSDATAEADEGFTVTLSSPSGGLAIDTRSATITIANDDIEAHDDVYVVLAGQALEIAASAGVLLNDADTRQMTASVLSAPTNGSLSLGSDGRFTYAPDEGFAGVDTFAYRASSENGAADAEVSILVMPVAAGEAVTLDLLALTAEQQVAATYLAFLGRGADADGFEFWVGELTDVPPGEDEAVLLADIASSFAISVEAQALHPFLADPSGATDDQISAFLDGVYGTLFNRASDAEGLDYWTGEVRQTLQAGEFVGSVLIDILSGAQDTAAGQDITTLMNRVAVSLAYVHEQQEHGMEWEGASDIAAATALLRAVTADPASVLAGIRNAEVLVAEHP